MEARISRRRFIQGVAAGTAIVGFNPRTRTWVTEADASTFDAVPDLDGALYTDLATREALAKDVGGLISRVPLAVLVPASVEDVQKMIRFCARRNIKVVARGQGHTVFGQSQVQNGLAIDMSGLNDIHSISSDRAVVGAGLKWKDLLQATLAQGQTPPVLTGYQGLSVGGTLSVGGVSGGSYKRGAQVDHVKELVVVDGRGHALTCSRAHRRGLFDAALAGQGQCGVIVEATIELVPATELVRYHVLSYTDRHVFFTDLRELVRREELDYVWASIKPDPVNGWLYEINTVAYFSPPATPATDSLHRGLSNVGDIVANDLPFFVFVTLVDGLVDQLRQIGLWDDVAHPWFDVFVADRKIESFVGGVLPTLNPLEDIGIFGQIQVFPMLTSRLRQPLFRVPDDDLVFLFDILTSANAPGNDPAYNERLLTRNRTLFEQARNTGGATKYPIAAIPFSRRDWVRQYGVVAYLGFLVAKTLYDPRGILTPGPGIF